MDKNKKEDVNSNNLKLHTFNVRGLRDKNKRRNIFTYIEANFKGITFLQETHALPIDIERWGKEWKGEIYMSCATSHSKGVAILIHKDVDHTITDIECAFYLTEFNGTEFNGTEFNGTCIMIIS